MIEYVPDPGLPRAPKKTRFSNLHFLPIADATTTSTTDVLQALLHMPAVPASQNPLLATPGELAGLDPPSTSLLGATVAPGGPFAGVSGAGGSLLGAPPVCSVAATLPSEALIAQQNRQATRAARRLFVGNLPTGIGLTGKLLCEFLNASLASVGITTQCPIFTSTFKADVKYCFVEFRSVDDCAKCKQLLEGICEELAGWGLMGIKREKENKKWGGGEGRAIYSKSSHHFRNFPRLKHSQVCASKRFCVPAGPPKEFCPPT